MNLRLLCKQVLLLSVAFSGAALAQEAGEGLVEQESGSAWHFRIGPVMAPRVRVKVSGPWQILPAQPVPRSSSSAGTGEGAAVADPSAGHVARQYVDGYVKPDEGTDDPDSIVSGLTWNWGASDVRSQYSGGRMEFHTDSARWSESVSASAYGMGYGCDGDRDILLGVEAMGGWTFLDNETFDAAVDAGFRFYGSGDLSATSRSGNSVTTTRSAYRFVDSYDASGWTDIPSGSYTGSKGGPGRILGATPTRREELMDVASSYETYYQVAGTKLNYRIWDLRLGPTLGWKALDFLTIRGGVYGLLGLVDGKLETSVYSSGGSYRVKQSKCGAVFGVAPSLSAQVNLTENLFVTGGVEYDWWSDDVKLNAGGANAKIELSDFTVSLTVGIEF